ncbi:DnaB-like helicase N-terminal domain-containing protein [Maridesulfovibrio bastinii]|uniref:DnaB-like helicase N-terminal domain-containing protein n=1 Tax=Maridesulfovibrio bastinii TaxID=47157 RepID=UPI0009FC3580|nr:DnaB-like helicase N-terminal domain-containing protein [Maridesulfovibrio bastinii]
MNNTVHTGLFIVFIAPLSLISPSVCNLKRGEDRRSITAPPNNPELERAVLSAVIRLNGRNLDSLLSILKSPDYFYSPVHQDHWQTMMAMHRD